MSIEIRIMIDEIVNEALGISNIDYITEAQTLTNTKPHGW